MKKYFFFSLLFLSLFAMNTLADNDCYTNNPCNVPWTTYRNHDLGRGSHGFVTDISMKYRICNGVLEIVLDIHSMQFDELFTKKSILQYDFDAAKAYIEYQRLQELVSYLESMNIITIGNCNAQPPAPLLGVRYYTSRCGVWVKCSYEVNPNTTVEKDDGYDGNCPLPINSYIDVYKWQPCGTVCCMKQFSVCYEYDTVTLNYTRKFTVVKSKVPNASCSLQGTFRDWRTNAIIPCQDGCEADGDQ